MILCALILTVVCAEIGMRVYLNATKKQRYVYMPDYMQAYKLAENNKFVWWGNDQHPEFRTRQRVNRLGLLGPEVSVEKPADTFRILVLGDSYTEAFQVEEQDKYTTVLERQLNDYFSDKKIKIEVLNAGVRGYSPIVHYQSYKTRWAKLNPDLVIVQMYTNDVFEDNHMRARSFMDADGLPIKLNYYFTKDFVDNDGQISFNPDTDYLNSRPHRKLLDWSRLYEYCFVKWTKAQFKSDVNKMMRDKKSYFDGYQFFILQDHPEEKTFGEKDFRKRTMRDTEHYLSALKNLVEKDGAEFLFFYIPMEAQLKLDHYGEISTVFFGGLQAGRRIDDMLEEYSSMNNVRFIDLLDTFQQNARERLYFEYDGHLTPYGQSVVAMKLSEYLIQNRMIK